ncbi:hypothetical protein PL11201_450030 [Planktothrix sp. PCC 11201]|uniref:hypothetical protein n=1 Tax=Planktothrix sp. PCC 11201 TaxID=1729650 RepID=UPI00091DB740|nr:hypothetical protein [Planktothrix sp. PCC 11201]SKB12871.1 hypothetical protein PL11201_450030 [Planktothrix sp. PCC 11201]
MNNNPLIGSIDSIEVTTINTIEKSSTTQPQKLDDFLDQTLIKFIDSVSFNSISHSPEIPANLVQAMQELIQIIAHLRSPNGAWPSNLPQTPENLIPYVIEEVSEVLTAYQAHSVSTSEIFPNSSDQKDSNIQPPVILFLSTLVPQLLWNLSQTSYQFMRLLTGINAEILLPNQDWTPGKLRLVASLIIKTEDLQNSIDLATSFFPPPFIPTEAYVQSNECSLCQHPLEVQSLLTQITHHIQDNFNQIDFLTDPVNTEIIYPKSQWEPSQIHIKMGFQFISDPETSEVSPFCYSLENDQKDEEFFIPTPIQDVEYSILASVSQASLLKTQIRLTDPGIIQPYIQNQIQNYGLHWLKQQKQSHNLNLSAETISTLDLQAKQSSLIDLIQIADELVDIIYSPQSPSSLMRLQPEMPLIELSLRLLWQMVKSNYNIMQLISGIKVKVLQPGLVWQTGHLRLLAVLNAEFPNDSWEVDIASSQPLKFDVNLLIPNSIIQSDSHEWCRFPQLIEFLKLQIINLLETTPELKSWIKGVKIDWDNSPENLKLSIPWKSGFAQLSFDFEWIPDQLSVKNQF